MDVAARRKLLEIVQQIKLLMVVLSRSCDCGGYSWLLRRLIAGSLFLRVPFDQLFFHPLKDDIRSTFNGMIEHEW